MDLLKLGLLRKKSYHNLRPYFYILLNIFTVLRVNGNPILERIMEGKLPPIRKKNEFSFIFLRVIFVILTRGYSEGLTLVTHGQCPFGNVRCSISYFLPLWHFITCKNCYLLNYYL